MDFSKLVQAEIIYMKDHYPTTAEEFNFQAELKAASHWCWPEKVQRPLSLKPGPPNDCRVKIAAQKTCQKWIEEVEKSDSSHEDDQRISGKPSFFTRSN